MIVSQIILIQLKIIDELRYIQQTVKICDVFVDSVKVTTDLGFSWKFLIRQLKSQLISEFENSRCSSVKVKSSDVQIIAAGK